MKVILTVRDDDEQWFASWFNFVQIETRKMSLFNLSLIKLQACLSKLGYMGTVAQQSHQLRSVLTQHPFQEHANDPIMPKPFTVSGLVDEVKTKEKLLRRLYLEHNEAVINTVAPDDLLVWNVKDGWLPLCTFLDKPLPNRSVPHDNKTGTEWFEKYVWKSTFVRGCYRTFVVNVALIATKVALVAVVVGVAMRLRNKLA